MNNIIENIAIYSSQPFLYELFTQCNNYKTYTITSFKELEEIIPNKFSLIIESPIIEVNWKYLESFSVNLKLLILLSSLSDNSQSAIDSCLNQSALPTTIPLIYLAKPFNFVKLTSIIERYSLNNTDNLILSENYTFSYVNKLIIKLGPTKEQNIEMSLTEKEAALLNFLYNAQGMPISKAEILERIWGYTSSLETHTLETHIYRLRQKLDSDSYLIYTYENKYGLKRHDF